MWEVEAKRRAVNLNRYDFRVIPGYSWLWHIEEGGNQQQLVRYTNQNGAVWAQSLALRGAWLLSTPFPARLCNRVSTLDMRADLVQIWGEGAYALAGRDNQSRVLMSLELRKSDRLKEHYTIEWWSGNGQIEIYIFE